MHSDYVNCRFVATGSVTAAGWKHIKCVRCGKTGHTPGDPALVISPCGDQTLPPPGVGGCLAIIFHESSVPKTAGCGCDAMIAKMNAWGPDGCREHRAEIIEHLKAAYKVATIATKAKALGIAFWNGYPLTLGGLLDMAIERAEQGRLALPRTPG